MFYDNLQAICLEKGVAITPLLKELNISTGGIGRWKRGGEISSDTLLKIANRLDVTTDYLLTGKKISSSEAATYMAPDEERILMLYRDLPDDFKEKVQSYIQGMHDTLPKRERTTA